MEELVYFSLWLSTTIGSVKSPKELATALSWSSPSALFFYPLASSTYLSTVTASTSRLGYPPLERHYLVFSASSLSLTASTCAGFWASWTWTLFCPVCMLLLCMVMFCIIIQINRMLTITLEGAKGEKVMTRTVYYPSTLILVLFLTCRTTLQLKQLLYSRSVWMENILAYYGESDTSTVKGLMVVLFCNVFMPPRTINFSDKCWTMSLLEWC